MWSEQITHLVRTGNPRQIEIRVKGETEGTKKWILSSLEFMIEWIYFVMCVCLLLNTIQKLKVAIIYYSDKVSFQRQMDLLELSWVIFLFAFLLSFIVFPASSFILSKNYHPVTFPTEPRNWTHNILLMF